MSNLSHFQLCSLNPGDFKHQLHLSSLQKVIKCIFAQNFLSREDKPSLTFIWFLSPDLRIKFVDWLVLPVNLFLAHPPFNNTARNSGAPFTSQYKCSVWAYLSVWDCCLFFSLDLQLGISYSQAGRKGCPHPLAVSSYVDIFWVTLPFHKGKKFTKMFTNAYG